MYEIVSKDHRDEQSITALKVLRWQENEHTRGRSPYDAFQRLENKKLDRHARAARLPSASRRVFAFRVSNLCNFLLHPPLSVFFLLVFSFIYPSVHQKHTKRLLRSSTKVENGYTSYVHHHQPHCFHELTVPYGHAVNEICINWGMTSAWNLLSSSLHQRLTNSHTIRRAV